MVDPTESNQLLSSGIAILVSEMECLIEIWTQIQTEGPITKSSYQKLKARFSDELILQNLVEDEMDQPDVNLDL